ncbi:MAG: acireductone synthase [Vicinamibacterales bacterium]
MTTGPGVTIRLADRGVRVVLLDIEGTTTPIAFVHDVLFPFARARAAAFLAAHAGDPEVGTAVAELVAEHAADLARGEAPPPVDGGLAPYVHWLTDRDRKSTGLKRLQGLVWEAGYQAGALHGQVYPDVAPALARWHAAGVAIAIYSSGSELAQRRLFESTLPGDLTRYLSGFFDTRVGGKRDAASYARIAERLGHAPAAILFLSDVTAELHAARDAGLQVALSLRPGNPPQPDAAAFETFETFDAIG